MSEDIKNITEGEAKDMILKYALSKNGEVVSSHAIQKEVLPEISTDEVELLFKRIQNSIDEVAEVTISEYNCFIESTGITQKFINQGGFFQSEKETKELEKKQAKLDELEFEKSIIDLRLKKWQVKTFWPIFFFAIIGTGLGVYNFINSFSPSKDSEIVEKRVEKMEVELKKLHSTISIQKTKDSLNKPKALKIEENTVKTEAK